MTFVVPFSAAVIPPVFIAGVMPLHHLLPNVNMVQYHKIERHLKQRLMVVRQRLGKRPTQPE